MSAEQTGLVPVDAATVKAWLDADEALLVDVRNPGEYAEAHIPGSTSIPLAQYDPQMLPKLNGRKLVIHCQAGGRATNAAERTLAAGVPTVYCFRGGMSEWLPAGYPVAGTAAAAPAPSSPFAASVATPAAEPTERRKMSVQEQTLSTIGVMVIILTVLGAQVNQALTWLLLIPGLGLLNAGLTGRCPLANAIARAPWNQ